MARNQKIERIIGIEMCVYCEKIKNVEQGTKKCSVLKENKNEEIKFNEKIELVAQKDKFGHSDVFIHHEVSRNGLYENISLDIRFCPICGNELYVLL